jgi:CheY-like chemotaxis protein
MLRILLIEDDPDIASVTSAMLEYLGYHVTTAGDGRRGFDIALQERPELVITDFMMPMMSGLQLIEGLRDEGYAAPVVLCSAVAESNFPPHKARYDVFLKKPYDLKSLTEAIDIATKKK